MPESHQVADLGRIVIIGASIAGLSAALAFHRRGLPVIILERDDVSGEPDEIAPEAIVRRAGVPHSMQPHFFISSLRNAFKRWYPGLVEEMVECGVREVTVDQCLPRADDRRLTRPQPGDEELTVLASRRAVFERALRNFVSRQEGIEIWSSAKALLLVSEDQTAPFRVTGVEIEHGDQKVQLEADVVVDASGRGTRFLDPFIRKGARVDDFYYKSKSAYYTRHYRLREGRAFPNFVGMPGVLFDDLVATTFVADGDNFVVSIVVNQDDPVLFDGAVSNPDVFEAILRQMPKAARWIEPDRAEPVSPVVGWANMDFFWRTLSPAGIPQVLGYFPVGDTVIRSNPKFGRGCTWSAIGADVLASAIVGERDPAKRLPKYEQALHDQFREDWEVMLAVDKEDQARFEVEAGLAPGTIRSKTVSLVAHWASNIAPTVDPVLYREIVRGYYGITSPVAWAKKPVNWVRLLVANLLPSPALETAREYSRRPSREFVRTLIAAHQSGSHE